MQPHRILLVEDDPRLGAEIADGLGRAGFVTDWIDDGLRARNVDLRVYSLVVLDLMLPGIHGFDLLKEWRQHSDVPVIILTARSDTHDKVRGFALGGDDYLTKPFWPEELVARIHARLRRPQLQRDDAIEVGAIRLELSSRKCTVTGELIDLTRVEFDLLAALCRRVDQAVTRQQLVELALGDEREGSERTLDVHISRIRKKLGLAAGHLETVWGVGYRLVRESKAMK